MVLVATAGFKFTVKSLLVLSTTLTELNFITVFAEVLLTANTPDTGVATPVRPVRLIARLPKGCVARLRSSNPCPSMLTS